MNTVVRPPAEDFAAAVPITQLEALCDLFDPPAQIAAGSDSRRSKTIEANEASILAMLRRRPCAIEHIEAAFGMHINEVSKDLGLLVKKDQIRSDRKNQAIYYAAK